jgi:outer membrane murein-binding lipoprotein Lpp
MKTMIACIAVLLLFLGCVGSENTKTNEISCDVFDENFMFDENST